MLTDFSNEDGSRSHRSTGYAPDFVAHLAAYLAYLPHALAADPSCFDLSLASVKHLDELLTHRKQESPSLLEALRMNTVAYYGEVLRTQVGGEWFFYVCPADKQGGQRYFPAIQSAEGRDIDFVGLVEKEFEHATKFCLYSYLFGLTRPEIPVQQWESHSLRDHLFPPLEKVPALRKVFPAKE